MSEFGGFLVIIMLFVIWLCLPFNANNTLDVNNEACHIAIKKKYPDSDIKMVKQVVKDNGENIRQIIYVVNGKFSESCQMGGRVVETEKRRLIPVEELLGVKK